MTPRLQIDLDQRQLQMLELELAKIPNGVEIATRGAVNKTARWVNTRLVRGIAAAVTMKQKDVRENVTLRLASRGEAAARILISGRRVVLFDWGGKPRSPINTRKSRQKATYQIARSTGRKHAEGSFIAKMRSGHIGIFKRVGAARLPIRELFGPSLKAVTLNTPTIRQIVSIDTREQLAINLASQVDRLLQRRKARDESVVESA